ncbi:MFS transporter [Promicromonospora soli]
MTDMRPARAWRTARWTASRTNLRRAAVVGALMLSAFVFNTTENLPIGVLPLISADLGVSLPMAGYLVSGYGLVVAAASLPLAHVTRNVPRRYLLSGVLAVLALASWLPTLADSYAVLLAARVVTALAQALFWAVQGPVAVSQFPPAMRGRIIGLLSLGGVLATVAGVPAGSWLGHRTSWETPFLVISVLAVVALTAVATALPTSRPEDGHAAYGVEPDRRRFLAVLTITALSVTGAFLGFTYVMEFLRTVTGLSGDTASALLGAFGVGGLVGVSVVGPLLDRYPRATLGAPVVVQAAALLALSAFGSQPWVVVPAVLLLGGAVSPVFMATQALVLRWAPGRTEMALAANSAAFNVGVALGAAGGGLVLRLLDVRAPFLVGGLLTVASLTLLTVFRGSVPSPATTHAGTGEQM